MENGLHPFGPLGEPIIRTRAKFETQFHRFCLVHRHRFRGLPPGRQRHRRNRRVHRLHRHHRCGEPRNFLHNRLALPCLPPPGRQVVGLNAMPMPTSFTAASRPASPEAPRTHRPPFGAPVGPPPTPPLQISTQARVAACGFSRKVGSGQGLRLGFGLVVLFNAIRTPPSGSCGLPESGRVAVAGARSGDIADRGARVSSLHQNEVCSREF